MRIMCLVLLFIAATNILVIFSFQTGRGETASDDGGKTLSVILSIDDQSILLHSIHNEIYLSLENDVDVCAIQTEVLFDTTCFEILSMRKTDRAREIDLFQYSDIEGGIIIVMTAIGGAINPGAGPIVDIFTELRHCHEGYYLWKLNDAMVSDHLGADILSHVIDGHVAILSGPKGDINNDDSIDVLDVVLSVRIALGSYPCPTEEVFRSADCNMDRMVDVVDVLGIVNLIIGLGECPP